MMISAKTLLYVIYFFAACAIILTMMSTWSTYIHQRERRRQIMKYYKQRISHKFPLTPEPSWTRAAWEAAGLIIPVMVLLIAALAITPY